jgi:hypothetical protein
MVGLVLKNRTDANNELVRFEKSHALAMIHRGFEHLTSVYGFDVWLRDHGVDLERFQTYFGVGALRLLDSPARSVAEQRSQKNLLEAQIARDNLDYFAFLADGQKGRGETERESVAEFSDRFRRWQLATAAAKLQSIHSGETYANTEAGARQRFSDQMDQLRSSAASVPRSADHPVCVRLRQKRRRDAVSTGTTVNIDVPDAPFSSTM